jgi:hypothetical protein
MQFEKQVSFKIVDDKSGVLDMLMGSVTSRNARYDWKKLHTGTV